MRSATLAEHRMSVGHSFVVYTKDDLNAQWVKALQSALPPEVVQKYADALTSEYVTLEMGRRLSEAQLAELKIHVGLRAAVVQAAENACARISETIEQEPSASVGPLFAHANSTDASDEGVAAVITSASMTKDVLTTAQNITWFNISGTAPTLEQFEQEMGNMLKRRFMPASFERAFADNKPMPFYLKEGPTHCLLLRVPDLTDEEGTTVATITNRAVIAFSETHGTILTYHRCAVNPFAEVERAWEEKEYDELGLFEILTLMLRAALRSYRIGYDAMQTVFDELEGLTDTIKVIGGLTRVQKRSAVYKRCLAANQAVLEEIGSKPELSEAIDALRDSNSTLVAMLDEMAENATGTIDMQMALDGFKSGENLKVFTFLSVVTQPIALATSWYGMNFTNMPDLPYKNSYYIFIGAAGFVALCLVVFLVVKSRTRLF